MSLKFRGGKLLFRDGHWCTTCCQVGPDCILVIDEPYEEGGYTFEMRGSIDAGSFARRFGYGYDIYTYVEWDAGSGLWRGRWYVDLEGYRDTLYIWPSSISTRMDPTGQYYKPDPEPPKPPSIAGYLDFRVTYPCP